MNLDVLPQTDWLDWLRRWDAHTAGGLRSRARSALHGDVPALEALLPASFVALDLACGPGSISQRLLARFPGARAIAVDIDPVMLAVGRGAIGTIDGRLRWVHADLASPDWLEEVGETPVDAVLSTTALHWLPPRCFAGKQRQDRPPGFGVHVAALRDAGFREVDTIWQALADRVVLAVR